MITDEDFPEMKRQLLEQIESTMPEDKKAQAKQQVEAMNKEQLEAFLKQNKMLPQSGESQDSQCIFCAIAQGKIPSTKIGENDYAIAILEINPVSKGHSIIIPKEHIGKPEDLSEEVKKLAKDISEKLKKLNPQKIDIASQNIMGHEVVNIIPVYSGESINSPRTKKTPEDLANIKNELDSPPIDITPKVETIEAEPKEEKETPLEDLPVMPPRFP